jgi:hypothetical protein
MGAGNGGGPGGIQFKEQPVKHANLYKRGLVGLLFVSRNIRACDAILRIQLLKEVF